MKKAFCIVLIVVIMAFALCACNIVGSRQSNATENDNDSVSESQDTSYTPVSPIQNGGQYDYSN